MFGQFKTVLIVEDTPDLMFIMTSFLEYFGLKVLQALHGGEAVEVLHKETVDLIVTDFRMPVLNGVELLNWCRERLIHVPVIFTTAEERLFPQEEIALGDCCATLLRKPVSLDNLHDALKSADHRRHERDCLTLSHS